MPFQANPMRVQQVGERLARYYKDQPVEISFRAHRTQGLTILVTRTEEPHAGITFSVDALDNGATGFREDALARINALISGEEYREQVPSSNKLVFDDVMTMR